MSILVKDMEMPKNCFWCPLSILNDNRLFCEVTKNEVVRAKIDVDCPLVPVPPHGRLIDADALLNDKGVRIQIAGWGEMFHKSVIECAPTTIEEERQCKKNGVA